MKQKSKFKQTEIGMIPEDWDVVKVGDFVEIKHGYAFKGKYFVDEQTQDIVLTPGNFNIGGGFKSDKFKYTTQDFPEDYVLHENDIVVTMTDLSKKGDTLGYAAKIPKTNTSRYLHNQRLGLLQFKSDNINKDFLYWVLRTRKYNWFVVGSATGSTVKHTSPNRIKVYPFGCPVLLDEQSTIAKILSDLDAKIELNNEMNKTLEEIAQTLFKHWFVNFEFPDENGNPYKSSGGKMTYNKELGKKIPKGWGVGKLGVAAEVSSGKRPSDISSVCTAEYPIELIGASSVMGYVKSPFVEEPVLITGRVGTHGIIQRRKIPCWPSDNTLVIKPDNYEYIFQFLKKLDFSSLNVGSTQPLITQTQLKKQMILSPPKNLLDVFERIVGIAYNYFDSNHAEVKNISSIRDSLLPKLMSGKIRVL